MKEFKKYLGKPCNETNRKKIVEQFPIYKVYFHPVGALVQLDSENSRLRVYYDEKNKISSIEQG